MNEYNKALEFFIENNIVLNDEQLKALKEGYIFSDKDLYYNKDQFENGDINLCFCIGLSGSGKTTWARTIAENTGANYYGIDEVVQNFNLSDTQIDSLGDMISSFFKGPGKKFRIKNYQDYYAFDNIDDFYQQATKAYVEYAKQYAAAHKYLKFILEGLWLVYCDMHEFDEYAVYIKGTSELKSFFRSYNRNMKALKVPLSQRPKELVDWFNFHAKDAKFYEGTIEKWRKYFGNKIKQK